MGVTGANSGFPGVTGANTGFLGVTGANTGFSGVTSVNTGFSGMTGQVGTQGVLSRAMLEAGGQIVPVSVSALPSEAAALQGVVGYLSGDYGWPPKV